ncbi:MAG: DUF4174 domain-containing protein [Planctomycetota bacterium]
MPATEELAEPFSLSEYRWAQRPLLIFAPDEGHDALRRMRGAVLASEEAFLDRDMVLVTAIGTRLGHASDRELTVDDIQSLRLEYDVPVDQLAALLIGKDGGVKRRETSFVSLTDIFEQIDGMPMRQDEMRKQ